MNHRQYVACTRVWDGGSDEGKISEGKTPEERAKAGVSDRSTTGCFIVRWVGRWNVRRILWREWLTLVLCGSSNVGAEVDDEVGAGGRMCKVIGISAPCEDQGPPPLVNTPHSSLADPIVDKSPPSLAHTKNYLG